VVDGCEEHSVRAAHCDPYFAGEEKGAAEAKELTACLAKGKRA
jgi:hypothetical protein